MINHNKTLASCFIGITNQAFLTNITAILVVPFMTLYDFTMAQFGLLIGINFASQMIADIILTLFIDKIKYKNIVQFANIISIIGTILFSLSPFIMRENPYPIILVATIIFAFASGMLEVILSPITDTIPDDFKNKKSAMSLMHSFYAWGQVLCIVYVSLSLTFFGIENWMYIVLATILVPIVCMIMFASTTIVEVRKVEEVGENKKVLKNPIFFLCAFAIMFGAASEIIMNQYVSSFCEINLNLSKTMSDMVGMVLFAVCLGLGRLLFGFLGHKVNIHKVLIISSFMAIICYAIVGGVSNSIVALIFAILTGFFVSLLWPGVLGIAGEVFPKAGAWIFSSLAIAGDVGAMLLPSIAGKVVDNVGFNEMFLVMLFVPILTFICHITIYAIKIRKKLLTLS